MENILITGAFGFLGSAVYRRLYGVYDTVTLGRSNANNINVSLEVTAPEIKFQVDMCIHCAGKAHMTPKTKEEKEAFFEVNVNGTANLLTAFENAGTLPKSFVLISTVAVYGVESGKQIIEENPLLATDPYGRSKVEAEQLVQEWCSKNNVICTILRLPLIAGANPPGNLGDMISGIRKGYYFNIGGGRARKSMVLASDVAEIIPTVAKIGGVYNLTDGCHPTFAELADVIARQANKQSPKNMPLIVCKLLAKIGDLLGSKAPINTKKLKKITSDLTFDDSKARKMLGWNPTPVLEGFKID